MSAWVPCTALLEGDATEAGSTFCTGYSVKLNLRSVFGERRRTGEGKGRREGGDEERG